MVDQSIEISLNPSRLGGSLVTSRDLTVSIEFDEWRGVSRVYLERTLLAVMSMIEIRFFGTGNGHVRNGAMDGIGWMTAHP